MGRKNKLKKKQNKTYPFVSICTPTYNRRPFIPYAIKCFESQTYPRDKMEWIIVDDGTDKIGDLVKDIPGVIYIEKEDKMTLGEKRNFINNMCNGEIIVNMDDDDFYPPCRVSHAVEMLQKNPKCMIAGISEIYVWFKHIQTMYQFGPYKPNHATAATFAYRRELLNESHYENNKSFAEEKYFLKDYTVPLVQLDPLKTILVFSHLHNTFDKKELLKSGENQFQKVSPKTVDMFIKDKDMKDFYMNQIDVLLRDYEPGDPKNKPDVIAQQIKTKIEREKLAEQQKNTVQVKTSDGKVMNVSIPALFERLQAQEKEIQELKEEVLKYKMKCIANQNTETIDI